MKNDQPTRLYFVALLYLTFPLFLFFIGWCSWFVALPTCGILIYLLFRSHRVIRQETALTRAPTIPMAITAICSLVWVASTGIWNLGFGRTQDWDVMRNDLLSTLTSHSWPVTHVFENSSAIWTLRHYLGFYLPGPLVGKVFNESLGVTLFATGAWMFCGVWIALMLLLRLFSPFGLRKYIALPLFVCFSGLDAIGSRIQGTLSLRPSSLIKGGHIEWWAEKVQFSSNTTLLHWAPQHALPSWIGALLVIHIVRSRNNYFLLPIICLTTFFWSPFSAIGIALLSVLLLAINHEIQVFIATTKNKPLIIAAVIVVGIPLFAYLQSGTSDIPRGLLFSQGGFVSNLQMLFKFVSLEFGIFAALSAYLLRQKIRESLVISVGLLFVLMLVVGLYNDFAMRASPALLVVIFVNTCEALLVVTKNWSTRLAKIALVGVLTVGTITPLFEFLTRLQTPFTPLRSPCIDSGCESDLTSNGLRNYNWTEKRVVFVRD